MDASPETADTRPPGQKSKDSKEVFENANTITKWLMSQPEGSRRQHAEDTFKRLLQDAIQSRQYHGNGQACVMLCSFVQQCAKSSDDALRQWALTETLSKQLFHFYLEWYEHDPHRALRQVLDILVVIAASNPSPETGKAVKEHILETLIAIVARKSVQQLTKSGLQCLDYLLNKRVVDLADIAPKYTGLEPSLAGQPELSLWKSFTSHLFSWMQFAHVSPLAGKCLVHVFRGLMTASDTVGFNLDVWWQWLQDALARDPELLEDLKHYVLGPIFKVDKNTALKLLHRSNQNQPLSTIGQELNDYDLLLQLATLELGKKYGMVGEPGNGCEPSTEKSAPVSLEETLLDNLLAHPSVSVRSSAFSLLISSQATTKPFSEASFDLLKKHLASFHADYDARVRNEVLGYTKNLIKRAKNIITVAQRSLAAHETAANRDGTQSKKKFGPEVMLKDAVEAKDVLDRHQAFLRWYMDYLRDELHPAASYQRHITAAKAILLLLQIGKHAGATEDVLDEDIAMEISHDVTWIRLLLDLLIDPFDDVRDGAATILSLLSPGTSPSPRARPVKFVLVLSQFCQRASNLADRTGRADHGDGAARAHGLMCSWLSKPDSRLAHLSAILGKLETKITKAEDDLGHAAIENPVHSDFAAISYIWQVLSKETYTEKQLETLHHLQRRIFFCAQRIWFTVKHVLCDDSPEGHLPEELEDIEGLDTKDLLSYSFRAVHESSNLLRLLVATLRQKKASGVPYPPLDVFRETGYLAFEQLATLRHRGAFSTVSYTFTTCCQLTQQLADVYADTEDAEELLREWYQGAINCIMTTLSTTRRSAGLPSLIAAVLAANAKSPSFQEVYETLEDIGKKVVRASETDGSNLPQVHALNSLREIFRSSLLSKKAEGYLARTLHLAATSLKSEVWAIRNCGLLLLRSLIDCLLGTGESKAAIESGWDGQSIRISYSKYPTLPGVLLNLLRSVDETLEQASQSGAAEAVFPVLDIIRRAGPPEEHRAELRKHIEGYLGSRLWHVREIAARTLCSFLLQGDWAKETGRLLAEAGGSANRLHGALLTARFVIERRADLAGSLVSESESIGNLLTQLAQRQDAFEHCAELKAAHLEILNLLARLGCNDQVTKAVVPPQAVTKHRGASSALLDLQTSLRVVYNAASSADVGQLREELMRLLETDVNTAIRMLEVTPEAWRHVDNSSATSELCALYLDICISSPAPGVRKQALLNLGSLLGDLLRHGDVSELPSAAQLDGLWRRLQHGEISPSLSCTIVETSGTIMAALLSQPSQDIPDMAPRLQRWGDMLSECLDVDNPFDTRYAAASALRSFFTRTKTHAWGDDAKYLPVLWALYDGLIDDDDEVREAAAVAASSVLSNGGGVRPVVAPIAATELASWMGAHFGSSSDDEFTARVICRMVGQPWEKAADTSLQLVPAEKMLREALMFDDSLFAAEEQNLFIDEVRETRRWRGVYEEMTKARKSSVANANNANADEASTALSLSNTLRAWAEAGMKALLALAAKGDGPLGWMTDQHVFAACARIVLCAVATTRTVEGGEAGLLVEMLGKFREVGLQTGVHGLLLEMARLEEKGGEVQEQPVREQEVQAEAKCEEVVKEVT
ncbi:hypothetical protein VTJ49DRAFT_1877 [Mycothermus thermophilus]|uniref:DUF2428 domain-containing protein n=1 Tax=Humicola insolens TaxID=85995 RepID=A0ABR3VBI5_HUMIN